MPRPNPGRNLRSEGELARRIGYEREQRGMSYAGLAERMTQAGCPINQSAIYKIEKGQPRRGISVSELVAVSQVFSIPVQELLLPLELVLSARTTELLADYDEAAIALRAADERLAEVSEALLSHVKDNPAVAERIEEITEDWARRWFDEGEREQKAALLAFELAPSQEDKTRYMRRVMELSGTAEEDIHG